MRICFDLDGTICTLWEAEKIAKFTLLDLFQKECDTPRDMISRIYDTTWAGLKSDYMNMLKSGHTEHSIRSLHMVKLLDELDITQDPDELATLQCDTTMKNIHIYHDAEQTINQLAEKYPLCMITNGASDNQRAKIKRLPFRDHFKEIIVSGELGHHKPCKIIFETMTQRMNAKPEEMIYIGNDYEKDILGAKNAGWKTIWINRKDEERDPGTPDHILKELSELLDLID